MVVRAQKEGQRREARKEYALGQGEDQVHVKRFKQNVYGGLEVRSVEIGQILEGELRQTLKKKYEGKTID